jgi:hypothetical protein
MIDISLETSTASANTCDLILATNRRQVARWPRSLDDFDLAFSQDIILIQRTEEEFESAVRSSSLGIDFLGPDALNS